MVEHVMANERRGYEYLVRSNRIDMIQSTYRLCKCDFSFLYPNPYSLTLSITYLSVQYLCLLPIRPLEDPILLNGDFRVALRYQVELNSQ